VGLAFGFEVNISSEILFLVFHYSWKSIPVMSWNFDNAGGTVEEISLRKTTLRDLDGTVHHIPHGEIKKVSNFLRISPV
jgi:small conductance mechanosensitive channel